MIAQILQVAQIAHALMGTEAARAVLAALGMQMQLTAEQQANLSANYADYLQRIERLKAEQGEA